jgi:hypothetical protein
MKTLHFAHSLSLVILLVATSFISNTYGQVRTFLDGVPQVILTNGQNINFNGDWDNNPEDISRAQANQGLWYEEGGWYIKPTTDGAGWEAGVLDPVTYQGGQSIWGTNPVKLNWTPESGWVITQAPEGATLSTTTNPFKIETLEWTTVDYDSPWVGTDGLNYDYATNSSFLSQNFVSGSPSIEWNSNWDNLLMSYYSNNPHLESPYGGGAGGVITQQAQELNQGLSFQDGQWTVQP